MDSFEADCSLGGTTIESIGKHRWKKAGAGHSYGRPYLDRTETGTRILLFLTSDVRRVCYHYTTQAFFVLLLAAAEAR